MKQKKGQILLVVGMLAILIAADFFDKWQNWLKDIYSSTLELQYMQLRLWSVPIAVLIFAASFVVILWFAIKYRNIATTALYLGTGICILFYPSIVMTLGISTRFGISLSYFGSSILFYSSALVAAIGLIGLLALLLSGNPHPRELDSFS